MFQAPRKLVTRFEHHDRPAQMIANGWPQKYRVAVLECGHAIATDMSPKRMACHQCPGGREVGRRAAK